MLLSPREWKERVIQNRSLVAVGGEVLVRRVYWKKVMPTNPLNGQGDVLPQADSHGLLFQGQGTLFNGPDPQRIIGSLACWNNVISDHSVAHCK